MKKILILLLLVGELLFARSDALVVGVGIYPNAKHKLIGVEQDIENIQTILDSFSVPKKNITILKDSQATLKRVRRAFKNYINDKNRNREGNIFIFYFSGHGLQVGDLDGDEGDGKDEATVLYDYAEQGKIISGGILLDDELYTLLTQIKSKKILIFDKCHSGSSYRGFVVDFKKVVIGDFNLSNHFAKEIKSKSNVNNPLGDDVVVLSATKDREIAEDSPLGGLFTKSLLDGIVYNKAVNKQGIITLRSLENFCNLDVLKLAVYIKKHNKGYDELKGAFHPWFRPNTNLNIVDIFNSQLKHTKIKSTIKPKQKPYLLEDMLDSLSQKTIINPMVTDIKKSFVIDDSVSIRFTSKKRGVLNVLIAYKNSYKLFMKNRPIRAGKEYTFPDDFFDTKYLIAQKPYGLTKIYFILSKKPWEIEKHIRDLGDNKRNDLSLSNAFSKELIPTIEYEINQKKKKIKEQRKVVRVKPNILTISKVEFNVTR